MSSTHAVAGWVALTPGRHGRTDHLRQGLEEEVRGLDGHFVGRETGFVLDVLRGQTLT